MELPLHIFKQIAIHHGKIQSQQFLIVNKTYTLEKKKKTHGSLSWFDTTGLGDQGQTEAVPKAALLLVLNVTGQQCSYPEFSDPFVLFASAYN